MNFPDAITKDEVVRRLAAERDRLGSTSKLAQTRHISRSLLAMTLAGDRPLADTAAIAAGYLPITIYIPVKASKA